MTDPISDFLTRIRNAQLSKKDFVASPCSKLKLAIAKVLYEEGYIDSYEIKSSNEITIRLKYYAGKPVIEHIRRISKPGLRIYKKSKDIPLVLNGLGIMIVSTSKGVMSDKKARYNNLGGELICAVY